MKITNHVVLFLIMMIGAAPSWGISLGPINGVVRESQQSMSLVNPVFLTFNSIRRTPEIQEIKSILRVGGCTGFFVENTKSEFYVATARHCVDFKATEQCRSGQMDIYFDDFVDGTVLEVRKHLIGNCKEIIAGTVQDDLFMMRVEFEDADRSYQETDNVIQMLRNSVKFLKLASYTLPQMARMKMIGFPADINALGLPTLTENCWDTSAIGIAYYNGVQTSVLGGNASNGDQDPQRQAYLNQLRRQLRWHNCSTWGGNSGGPMILEGTDDVVGIPGAYNDEMDQETVYPDERVSSFYETTAGFIARNRLALQRAGVVISEKPPTGLINTHVAQTRQWIRESGYRQRPR